MRSASGHTIFTRKNKKKVERKLELKKFDPKTRTRVIFKEVKK
jgi:ribosomal protein L33